MMGFNDFLNGLGHPLQVAKPKLVLPINILSLAQKNAVFTFEVKKQTIKWIK